MLITEGQTIVHPQHGPAVVESILPRRVRGAEVEYLTLRLSRGGLLIHVPRDRAAEIGLRPLFTPAEIERLLERAAAPETALENQWSRRIKDYRDRLSAGDMDLAITVVRDLARRSRDHGLSLAEKEMLREAGAGIVDEWSQSLGRTPREVQDLISTAIFGAPVSWSSDIDEGHNLGS